jgi:transcriptional regulator with XRE-family HTH domain
MDISLRIKQLRKAAGLNVSQLAEAAGLSQSYLSEIEHGKKKPTVDTILKLCSALNLSLADLFSDQPATPVPPHLRPLVEAARDLTPEQVELLLPIIREFKKRRG